MPNDAKEKLIYQTPVVMSLGELARGSGKSCYTGTGAHDACTAGNGAESHACRTGDGAPSGCSRGNGPDIYCSVGTGVNYCSAGTGVG